VRSVINTLL